MYIPKEFRVVDRDQIIDFCSQNSFATLVSVSTNEVETSHVPLIIERSRAGFAILKGHLARANPHWQTWTEKTKVVCIFHGPHHYISPAWYSDPVNVPTWNYAVAHLTGQPRLLFDHESVESILTQTVAKYETLQGTNWRYDLPEDFRRDLTKAIVGFEIEVSDVQVKFKMSQNRSSVDREGAISGLQKSNSDMALATARMMGSRKP